MTSSIQPTSNTNASVPANSTSILGKDDFLKMLIAQLKFQDPLNPLNGTEFAAQLAQFSSVEQLTNIKTSLSQFLNTNIALSNSINNALAASFIGKDVKASASSFSFNGEGTVQYGYSLQQPADTVVIKIYNEYGGLVKTIIGTTQRGENTLRWNGIGDDGIKVANGRYSFTIEATDFQGNAIVASPFIYGKVTGVRFKSDGTVFVIEGSEVLLSDIVEIKER